MNHQMKSRVQKQVAACRHVKKMFYIRTSSSFFKSLNRSFYPFRSSQAFSLEYSLEPYKNLLWYLVCHINQIGTLIVITILLLKGVVW